MKRLLFILMLVPSLIMAQDCYTVDKVSVDKNVSSSIQENYGALGVKNTQKRITFGIKQMLEDIISDKYD